ncbi:MAG: pilus assembly protein FimV [Gammaproteobacteria bacterium]|jgi:pilus assembly protein FimV
MHPMIRKSALAATIAALLNPAVAGALGLGNIEVSSALNEPLKARIPLRGVDSGAADELKAALGSDKQFSRAGLDRVFALSSLRFKIVQNGATSGYIEITTRDPVAEPFLNFLVDVNWPNGRVLREYTVLLDPPVYGAAIRSATARSVETVSALPVPKPAPAAVVKPAAPSYSASSAPTMAPAISTGTPSGFSGDSYGPVRDGETLWSIADSVRPGGTSIQSMMLALLRANPQGFSIDNVNALKTGAVLRIPAASEVRDDRAQALAEVSRQHGLWDEYRQSIGASVQPQPGGAAAQSSAPAMTDSDDSGSAAMAKSPSTDRTSNSELQLVGGGTSGTTAGGGAGNEADIQALRDNLSIAQEEAEAAKLENGELQSRLGEVEGIVEDMKRLVELREDQLAALQGQLTQSEQARETEEAAKLMSSEPAMESKPEPAPKPMAAAEPTPDKPAAPAVAPKPAPIVKEAAAAKPPPPPPVPEPASLLDDIQSMVPVPLWTVLAGVGALLLGFGGLRMARARKAAAGGNIEDVVAPEINESGSLIEQYARTELPDNETDEDATEMPEEASADAEALVDDDDKTEMVKTPTAEPAGAGTSDEDPLAEVNVYLAYERFEQAEQLVRDAIETYPERPQYRLKLLEVFYAAKNVAAYELAAEELQAAVGPESEMVEQAHAWWGELGTGRELFSDDDGPDTAQHDDVPADGDDLFDVTSAESGEQTGVDFDLGFDALAGDVAEGGSGLDFDLGVGDGATGGGELDFDLGDLGEAGTNTEDNPATQQLNPAGVAALSSSTGIDFDLGSSDFGESTPDDASTSVADESVDSGLDFAIDTDSSAGSSSNVPGRIGGDDSDLDFDLGSLGDAEQSASVETGVAGDDLDFSLDDGSDSVAGLGGTGADDDSRLDFDLGGTTTFGDDSTASDPLQDVSEAALDFDLGDTGGGDAGAEASSSDDDLDFNVGDTGGGAVIATDQLVEDATSDGAEIDFDLGETAASISTVVEVDSASTDGESALDFDLGDTGAGEAADSGSIAGEDLGLDLDLGVGSDDDEPLSLDMGSDEPGNAAGSEVFQDANTQIGDESDLDLVLDMGNDTTSLDFDIDGSADADELPVLDMGEEGGAERGSIDTVKLSPDAMDSLRPNSDGSESEFGVDTEFLGIFSADDDDSSDDNGVGTSSSLDFDLGTDLGDVADANDSEAGGSGAVLGDLEQTQFSLRDVPLMGADEDDEDHTLVLGRGASGEVDEMQTKLDLAQAYMDMGDSEVARNLLGEVMADGGDDQQGQAREMLSKLS